MAAFSPRDFHCTQQALVIRNRNLTLFFLDSFFSRIITVKKILRPPRRCAARLLILLIFILCNDLQDELKFIKTPPLFPAFPPRDFYSTSLTLEIRNRNLPVNLFYSISVTFFLRRITVEQILRHPRRLRFN